MLEDEIPHPDSRCKDRRCRALFVGEIFRDVIAEISEKMEQRESDDGGEPSHGK